MQQLTWIQQPLGRKEADAAARWLLEFKETDLDRVSALVHQELVDGLVRFMSSGGTVTQYKGEEAWEYLRVMVAAPAEQRAAQERFYTIDRLRPLQAALKQGLGMLFKEAPSVGVRRSWSNKLSATEKLVRDLDGNIVLVTENAGDLMAVFGSQVFRVLLAVSPRLRRCEDPKCGRLFIATKRQKFCCPQHAVRVRVARMRTTAKGKEAFKARRRAAYAKRTKAKRDLPASTRVGRIGRGR